MQTPYKTLLGAGAILTVVAVLQGCVGAPETARRTPRARPHYATSPRYTPPIAPTASERQCLADLGAQNAQFTPLPDRYFGQGCSNVGTVRLSSLATDHAALQLTNLGPVTCNMADHFAGWARYGVNRAARQILGSPVVRIETFGSYNCRNIAGSNRRSGHATANAIDVSGFVLADGRRITVLADWNGGTRAEQRFLRVVHDSACKRFGTVLGPDYNAAHTNHFHLEATGSDYCR